MGQPKLMNKGGFAMWFDATFVITFGKSCLISFA